ncbi:MAG: hypothetical protein ABSH09_01035 [Bryobacteraceae bacterium]
MATSQHSIGAGTVAGSPVVSRVFSANRFQVLLPSFSDCFFIALFLWLFVAGSHGWDSLLTDADIGWHIRAGDWIMANHSVPTHDLFSFSKPGAEWFAWEWLSDVIFALLFRAAGLKGVVLLAGVVIGLYATVMVRYAFWRGANAMVALPLALLGVGSSTVHFLARPHVFTLLFLAVALWLLEKDRQRNTRALWLLIPLTVLWVNLHGGFFMFLACLFLLVAGSAIEAARNPEGLSADLWSAVRRYAILFAACSAASIVNPYGIGLHRHIATYLQSDWIRNNIQEFMAPTFRTEGQLQFELILILGLLTVTLLLRKGRIVEALWVLFFAHSSLTSVRHAPLFCLLAVPLIADELSSAWKVAAAKLPRGSLLGTLHTLGVDLAVPFRRSSVWIPLSVAIVALAPLSWPVDFPKEVFPTAIVAHNSKLFETGRILTTDQWGDYLIFHYYPRIKVYVDGRSDFYGEQLGDEYMHILQLSSDWKRIFERRGFDVVLLPSHWPVVEVLRGNPEWHVVEETTKAVLFLRCLDCSHSPSPTHAVVLKKTLPEANENIQPRRSLYTGDRRDDRV